MAEAASLIREHLWLGKVPPPPPHPSQGKWTMGRDLSIWKRLLFSGRTPDEINAAIQHVRSVLLKHDGVPLRMTVFYNGQGYATPIFEQTLGLHHKNAQTRKAKQLPPTVRDILRSMVG